MRTAVDYPVIVLLLQLVFISTTAFTITKNTKPCSLSTSRKSSHYHQTSLYGQNNDDDNDGDQDREIRSLVDVYTPLLDNRLTQLRAKELEEQLREPPNPSLTPTQLITYILHKLRSCNSHSDSGYRTLIRASTVTWRSALRKSIGAPEGATEDQLISSLDSAMSRPDNQYKILVSSGTNSVHGSSENDSVKNDDYTLYFPTDVLDYDDGKAWVESQLRDPQSGELLAILGWNLVRRDEDEAWLIEWLDWQDFRDQ
jgi:hypothetical protein